MTDPRRATPSVNAVLDALDADRELLPRVLTVRVIRATLDEWKEAPSTDPVQACRGAVRAMHARRLRPVINATGVLLHTNLGRAPMSVGAAERVSAIARNYSTLEFDPVTGKRGDRQLFTSELVAAALGTEAAVVVNNGAAGVLLACSAIASGRDVVVSRGELVEIGGSFRIPDIVTESGANLLEVGTTNRTHLRDYTDAVTEETAMILRVHPSNYRISGFTSNVEVAELRAAVGAVPIIVDAGSGLFGSTVADEPEVAEVLAQGASLVIFSGDKLFGGPQAGVIAGEAQLVAQLSRSPLYRALRCGKLTIAALNQTLLEKLNDTPNPVTAGLTPDIAELRIRGTRIAEAIGTDADVTDVAGAVGGGSLPGWDRPSVAVAVATPSPAAVSMSLLAHEPPVVARIEDDTLVLDLSCVDPADDETVVEALRNALGL